MRHLGKNTICSTMWIGYPTCKSHNQSPEWYVVNPAINLTYQIGMVYMSKKDPFVEIIGMVTLGLTTYERPSSYSFIPYVPTSSHTFLSLFPRKPSFSNDFPMNSSILSGISSLSDSSSPLLHQAPQSLGTLGMLCIHRRDLAHSWVANGPHQKSVHIYTYIHIYIYTYIHIHIYICIYTYMHIYIYTYAYIHIHIYICTYIHVYTCTCIHITYTYTYTHIHPHTHTHAHTYIYIYIYIHIPVHLHIHNIFIYIYIFIYSFIHIFIDSYIHIFIYTYIPIPIPIHLHLHLHIQIAMDI